MFCIQLRGACTTASGISPSPWWDSRDPVLLLSTLPSLVDLHITECPLGLLQGSEFNLCRQYEEKVRPCIDLIDSLRALGVERDLALPAIAVIGDQSSGKSSVLEALSGVALPRGSGENSFLTIVLGHLVAPRAVLFSPQSGAQNLIAGTGLGISDELISLEVSSPSVPDLTLIDLPGITRVAVGNQPTDIGRQIKRLIRKYIQKQETINLVVVPSNVDIATTEALSMAQEVDPDGDRTIGILTKPDLVDKGTEDTVVDVVRNLVCHLKKGYMIVKCRGQQDIQSRLSLAEALQKEKAFFEDHPQFRALLDEGKATIPCLAERLTTELIAHICKSLPLLENQIKENIQKVTEELKNFGVGVPEEESEKTFFLIEKINEFNQDINAIVQAEEVVGPEEMRLFTRMRKEFHKWSDDIEENFQKELQSNRFPWKFENQYRGRELPGFVNYRTFETIIKEQLRSLEEPAVDMLHTVTGEHHNDLSRFQEAEESKIEDIRLEQEQGAERWIRLHFQMEQIVYCQDQVYRGALQGVREKEAEEEKRKSYGQSQSVSAEESSMAEIFQHLDAYRKEAHNRISSLLPLIIQFFVLKTFGQKLQTAMLMLLQDKDACGWLLKERSDTSDKRKFLKERLSRLTQARHRLAKFPG
uniref:MX dynamin like GTPase 1 n=1 Tax=Spermophilus dauricus TaxID=99837 RepID=A0A8C9QDY7_SPEDA